MIQKTNVPENTLPRNLDPENALKIHYKTNILFPTFGPLTGVRFVDHFTNLLDDLMKTVNITDTIADHIGRYREPIPIPKTDPIINPYDLHKNVFRENLVQPLQSTLNIDLKSNIMPGIRNAVAKHSNIPIQKDFDNMLNWENINLEQKEVSYSEINAEQHRKTEESVILLALSEPNTVLEDLFQSKQIGVEDTLKVNEAFLEKEKSLPTMVNYLSEYARVEVTEEEMKRTDPVITKALESIERRYHRETLSFYQKDDQFRYHLQRYLISKMKTKPLRRQYFPLPKQQGMNQDREWAFQRFEELRLKLQSPVLRGPVKATSVAPESKHVFSDTYTQSISEERTFSAFERNRKMEARSILSTSSFKQALDNLTEYGVADSNAFRQEQTLNNTLLEERRKVVDTVIEEVSNSIENTSSVRSENVAGSASEYTTNGKDPNNATTELEYKVVVPAQATVKLRDVGLVWSPRVISPFKDLHQTIARYMEEQRRAYIEQHHIPTPVEPVMKKEKIRDAEIEVGLAGDDPINKKRFQYTAPQGIIDKDSMSCSHRNGGWDDWDIEDIFSEVVNSDDLEHAVVRLEDLVLSEDKKTIKGTAILETNDPEALNYSYIKIKIPLVNYTDESIAARRNYEQQIEEKEHKEKAIRSRAVQYARMKRDELIAKYENDYALKKEAFYALISRIFASNSSEHRSYYKEVISRCVNWEESHIEFESQPMNRLLYPHLAPDHFMNCPAIRFFLPIQKNAEDIFFDTIKENGLDYHEASAKQVRDYLNNYRDSIHGDSEKILDTFDTEVTIGRHLEAVLSNYQFSE